MKQHVWQITMMVAVLVALAGGAVAEGEFLMHGRVSFDTGTAMVKNATEENWSAAVVNTLVMPGDTLWVDQSGTAELELAGGSFLRFADGSKAEVVALPPSASIRGWAGSFYVHRLARSQGDFIFTTPSGTVEIPADTQVRVDIDSAGAATVSVRWGSARVRTDQGGEVTATENMRVWIDPGMLPSEPTPFDRAQTDAFDDWNSERTRMLAGDVSTAPKDVVIQESTVGRYDLDRYGEWVYVDNRSYWRPTVVVDYVPYRHGYWNYMPSVGHVWVDEYPFAYVTTHYGRWCNTPSYGWLWSYDPVWSPAWVASVRVGDYYAWSPVDYYNRPVIVAGASVFSLGGVSFCSYSTSYVSHSYLYAGPTYVYAPTTVIINTFNTSGHVNVWNIAHDRHSRPAVPYDSRFIGGERDYNPRRSIRGGQGDWVKDYAPSDRASRLEASLGRTAFASTAAPRSTGQSVRTSSATGSRTANTRQVRLGQTEQTYVARSARTSNDATTNRSMFVPESTKLGSRADRSGGSIRSSISGQDSLRSRANETTSRDAALSSPQPERSGQRSVDASSGRNNLIDRSTNSSGRVAALRDMESSAPAPSTMPRTSVTPERTTVRQNSGTLSPRTAPSSAAPQRTTTPSPNVGRSTPAPSPTVGRSTQTATPSQTIRRESAPIQRSAPSPAPSQTMRRSAPAPTPAPSPTVRRESAPIQRSAPAPSPMMQRESPSTSSRSYSAPPMSSGNISPSTRSLSAPRSSGISAAPPSSMSSGRSDIGNSPRPQRPPTSSGGSARGRR